MDQVELLDVAARLRRLLEVAEAGEVEASAVERAYVAGAAGVLEQLADRPPFL